MEPFASFISFASWWLKQLPAHFPLNLLDLLRRQSSSARAM
jgi:hypothetical protein